MKRLKLVFLLPVILNRRAPPFLHHLAVDALELDVAVGGERLADGWTNAYLRKGK